MSEVIDVSEMEQAMDMEFSRDRKMAYLLELSEDEFRDRVVRPVFEHMGMRFVRDTCGTEEEGKDCIFVGEDTLKRRLVYVVQTKRGNINLASKVQANVVTACTQLETALKTTIYLTATKERVSPDYVLLCASGSINNAARRHIHDTIPDRRIGFYDANDLLPHIDDHLSEFWFGIDAKLFPYLRKLKKHLLEAADSIVISEILNGKTYCPIRDDSYVTLFVDRVTELIEHCQDRGTELIEHRRSEVKVVPKFDQIPIQKVLGRRERLVLIRGEGGSGKTTALRRLALELVDESLRSKTVRIPVFLTAKSVAESSSSLAVLAGETTRQFSAAECACFSDNDLLAGNVVLLVDALDEVFSEDARKLALKRIADFNAAYPNCYVIMTSRGYSSVDRLAALRSFTRYNLTALDLRHATKIVENLARGRRLQKEDATEMLRRLQDVHGIALSPLLVTVFVATSDFKRRDIPPNITEIFSKFTELMLGRWDEKKGLSQQFESKLKDFVLCQIAVKMHKLRIRAIPLSAFESEVSALLEVRGHRESSVELIEELLYRSNLLRVDEDRVEFRHHMFQEFFAGRGVADSGSLAAVVSEEWWRKPIIFFFGNSPSNQAAMKPLMEAASSLADAARYDAAITIGLAMQACYLAETPAKADTLHWVVRALASTCDSEVKQIQNSLCRYELSSFNFYYIFGRDAVATDPIRTITQIVLSERAAGGVPTDISDRELFWCIVGLIESGHISEAEPLIRRFKPKDQRLLLALHLGCFYVANLRVSTSDQKKIAKRLSDEIASRIRHLLKQVFDEMKGYLLEMRDGQMKRLDNPAAPIGETQQDQQGAEIAPRMQ